MSTVSAVKIDRTLPPGVARSPTAAVPPESTFKDQLDRAELERRAGSVINNVVGKFIATALIYPMLEQISDSPFKTEMFDGGFTEHAFRSRLNTIFADEIGTSTRMSLGQALNQRLTDWLRVQNDGVVRKVAEHKGIDTIG